MPAPQTTATPQPRSVPARSTAKRVVARPTIRRAQPRAADRLLQLELLGREVDAGEQQLGDVGERLAAAREPRLARGLAEEASSTSRQPVDAEVVRRAERPAHEREHRARRSRTSARSVFELPPSTARTVRVRWRSPAPRSAAGAPRPASSRRSTSSAESAYWPISGCASSALRATTAVAGHGRRARRAARTRRRAATRPSSSGASGACGQRRRARRGRRAPAPRRRRRRRRPASVAVVAHVDHVDVAVAVGERGDEADRRLAVERAAALLEQRRLLGRATGRGTARAARARSRPPGAARGTPSSCSASTSSCA